MCTNPLRLFEIDEDTRKIFGKEVHHIEIGFDGKIIPVKSRYVNPNSAKVIHSFIEIPCRTCYECRKDHARVWSERCMAELKYHDSSFFLTLTYDDNFIHRNDRGLSTLDKRDLQLFWKRLRADGQRIRYFACGEYGSESMRSHMHSIVFGLKLDDLEVYSHDITTGLTYYTSKYINDKWKLGNVIIGDVDVASCRYVAGYVDKKLTQDKSIYKKLNIAPEFITMSRRPAIGFQYVLDNPGIYSVAYSTLSTPNGAVRIHKNSYMMRKLKENDLDTFNVMTKQLNAMSTASKRIRKRMISDIEYYPNLDKHDKYLRSKVKKRGDCVG